MDILKLFQNINEIIYEALLWIILAPKTVVKILVKPKWISGYIGREVHGEDGKNFDNYLSPVLLLLLIVVFPLAFIPDRVFGSIIPGIDTLAMPLELRMVITALFLFSYPLLMAVGMNLLSGKAISRSELKFPFFMQCYCFAPTHLIGTIPAMIIDPNSMSPETALAILFAFLFIIVWFAVCQTHIMKRFFNSSALKAFGLAVLIYAAAFAVFFIFLFTISFGYQMMVNT